MWSIASSTSSTMPIATTGPRNSVAKSSSVRRHGVGHERPDALVGPDLDARRGQRGGQPGQEVGGHAACTRIVSAALQTPERWVLALTTSSCAMARSAAPST